MLTFLLHDARACARAPSHTPPKQFPCTQSAWPEHQGVLAHPAKKPCCLQEHASDAKSGCVSTAAQPELHSMRSSCEQGCRLGVCASVIVCSAALAAVTAGVSEAALRALGLKHGSTGPWVVAKSCLLPTSGKRDRLDTMVDLRSNSKAMAVHAACVSCELKQTPSFKL